MVASGVLLDAHMVYFDARLSERYPTVEVRVADVCLDVADTMLVAGLPRVLVETVVEQLIRHVTPALRVGGDLDRVARAWTELQRRGTGAETQRQLARDAGDLTTVVREAVRRTV